MRFSTTGCSIAVTVWLSLVGNFVRADDLPKSLDLLIENHCVDCHDDFDQKGGLDLLSLEWDLEDPHLAERWVKVYDQIAAEPWRRYFHPNNAANSFTEGPISCNPTMSAPDA